MESAPPAQVPLCMGREVVEMRGLEPLTPLRAATVAGDTPEQLHRGRLPMPRRSMSTAAITAVLTLLVPPAARHPG